jgi:hypothetical protein
LHRQLGPQPDGRGVFARFAGEHFDVFSAGLEPNPDKPEKKAFNHDDNNNGTLRKILNALTSCSVVASCPAYFVGLW